jgi:chromosome segregation ATPase
MTADYAALEARVAELEQQMRHMLPAKVDAVSYAVSLVHGDTRYLREQSDIHGAALQRLETRLDGHSDQLHQLGTRLDGHSDQLHQLGTRLDGHGDLLQQILRRLPPRADGEA